MQKKVTNDKEKDIRVNRFCPWCKKYFQYDMGEIAICPTPDCGWRLEDGSKEKASRNKR